MLQPAEPSRKSALADPDGIVLRVARFKDRRFRSIDALARRIHVLRKHRSIAVNPVILPPRGIEREYVPAVEVRLAGEDVDPELIGFVIMGGPDRARRVRAALEASIPDPVDDEGEEG